MVFVASVVCILAFRPRPCHGPGGLHRAL